MRWNSLPCVAPVSDAAIPLLFGRSSAHMLQFASQRPNTKLRWGELKNQFVPLSMDPIMELHAPSLTPLIPPLLPFSSRYHGGNGRDKWRFLVIRVPQDFFRQSTRVPMSRPSWRRCTRRWKAWKQQRRHRVFLPTSGSHRRWATCPLPS
jgi:hypothetical protein